MEARKQASLSERFSGSLLGAVLGDIIGAAVEAESPAYIRKHFKDADSILALESVPEIFGGKWEVGKFTDDTQMAICVAEWLANDDVLDGRELLSRFSRAYEPWRRYGPGAAMILEAFKQHRGNWRDLATMMFPQGSYGNGSAMRVGPVGLFFHNDLKKVREVAQLSSLTTHAHTYAIQGATLQATAVALATRINYELVPTQFLQVLESALSYFEDLGEDTSPFKTALKRMAQGLAAGSSPAQMAEALGTGVKAHDSVPIAIYCFLANPGSLVGAIESAVMLGGDTDTIASMSGAISGAYLGANHIPTNWLNRVRETTYNPKRMSLLSDALFQKGKENGFKVNKGRGKR